jgi:DNA-binding response OmpR family regulator
MQPAPAANILVVDDDQRLRDLLNRYLAEQGFGVQSVPNGAAMEKAMGKESVDMIILDLMLPDEDGMSICRRLRAAGKRTPIIMLTAKGDEADRIAGLDVGADDYLPKPFNPRELVARVKSVLRRSAPERRKDESREIRHGDVLINAGRREVLVGDEEIQLAPKEFDLLWELLDHRGLVLTRDQLLERVWGYTFAGDTRTVDVHVRQLRRKLGDASPIVTVWGVGYKVAPARETQKDAARG